MNKPENEPNPYATPESPINLEAPHWYLKSACRIYTVMGWIVIFYAIGGIIILLYQMIYAKDPGMFEIPIIFIFMVTLLILSSLMVITAKALPTDFLKLYKRARWLGLLIGALFCPILAVPAFLALSRLEAYRKILVAGSIDSSQTKDVIGDLS